MSVLLNYSKLVDCYIVLLVIYTNFQLIVVCGIKSFACFQR